MAKNLRSEQRQIVLFCKHYQPNYVIKFILEGKPFVDAERLKCRHESVFVDIDQCFAAGKSEVDSYVITNDAPPRNEGVAQSKHSLKCCLECRNVGKALV